MSEFIKKNVPSYASSNHIFDQIKGGGQLPSELERVTS